MRREQLIAAKTTADSAITKARRCFYIGLAGVALGLLLLALGAGWYGGVLIAMGATAVAAGVMLGLAFVSAWRTLAEMVRSCPEEVEELVAPTVTVTAPPSTTTCQGEKEEEDGAEEQPQPSRPRLLALAPPLDDEEVAEEGDDASPSTAA